MLQQFCATFNFILNKNTSNVATKNKNNIFVLVLNDLDIGFINTPGTGRWFFASLCPGSNLWGISNTPSVQCCMVNRDPRAQSLFSEDHDKNLNNGRRRKQYQGLHFWENGSPWKGPSSIFTLVNYSHWWWYSLAELKTLQQNLQQPYQLFYINILILYIK